MKGRKSQSADLKIIKGTRSDRVNDREPSPPAGRPVCPERFHDDEVRAEWVRLCDALEGAGVLTPGHGFALAIYCGAYARLLSAEKALFEHGPLLVREQGIDEVTREPLPPVIKSNPAAAIAARCEAQMARVLAEFGLTPSSVSRVKARAEGTKDRFAEFIARKRAK